METLPLCWPLDCGSQLSTGDDGRDGMGVDDEDDEYSSSQSSLGFLGLGGHGGNTSSYLAMKAEASLSS